MDGAVDIFGSIQRDQPSSAAAEVHKTCGEVDSYDELHAILRARADELGLTREDLDDVAGLAAGYAGKILGPRQRKRLGPVSWSLFKALGLKVMVVPDDEATMRTKRRIAGGPPRCSLTRVA